MIPRILVATSTEMPTVRAEETAGGTKVVLDFHSVAGLLDAIAGNAPARLSTLLTIIWETSFKEEMRHVLGLAIACRDPLADLGTICVDALQAAEDLEKLAEAQHWMSLAACVGHSNPRASALNNLCDHQIERLSEHNQKRRLYLAIRQRLSQAAALERQVRIAEIQALQGLRVARCANIWKLYEKWRDTE